MTHISANVVLTALLAVGFFAGLNVNNAHGQSQMSATRRPTRPARPRLRMEFVWIAPGSFEMGSPDDEAGRYPDEGPAHRVTISRGFFLGKYEVTQAQWRAVMGRNPSKFKNCPQCPVDQVWWRDVQRFIAVFNARKDGFSYRLPTEAEWEYAARAGSTGPFAGDRDSMAWFKANSGDRPHPVGQKQPNAWGLFDMHGNVWEWVQDRYGYHYYEESPATDPPGPNTGSDRSLRGGGYYGDARNCRSAFRTGTGPRGGQDNVAIGFRLVRIATNRK